MRNSAVSCVVVTDFNIQISVLDPSRGTMGRLRAGVGCAWPPLSYRRPGLGLLPRALGAPSLMTDGFPLVRFVVKARGPRRAPLWVQTSAGHCPPEDVGHIRGHFAPYSWGRFVIGSAGWSPGRLRATLQCSGYPTSRNHRCKMPVMLKWGKPGLDYKEQWVQFA